MRPAARIAVVYLLLTLVALTAQAQSFDPPANYYSTATGAGATLKSQLHNIIDGHTNIGYDAARTALQVTDADVAHPGHMITAYDRISLNVAAINGGPIPGWDNAATWNREHTWPRSRGVGSSGPDDADLFALRPALTDGNGDRANYNFGGAFGQPHGLVAASPNPYWYPGDADAGMIARQQFYMAVRYDGSDGSTSDLELTAGNPSATTSPPQAGDLNRLLEWHYLAPPDAFERRRNQIIYDQYQHNRNPFTDRPEYVWSVFVNQTNDSSLSLQGASPSGNGGTSLNVDLGRVLVGAAVPAAQTATLNKAGLDGTYYQVTAAGQATSSASGRYNAFATGATGSKAVNVGLATTTATAGLRSGTVTIDNLDVTTGGGAGRGANDGDDVVNVSLSVLNHANPSFNGDSDVNSLGYDFGTVTLGAPAPTFGFDIFNLPTTAGFTAGLDFDSFNAMGDVNTLAANIAPFAGANTLSAGMGNHFTATFDTSAVGTFSTSYTLAFSDEDLPGATSLAPLRLTFTGVVEPAAVVDGADFDSDGDVDGADFLAWQQGLGTAGATPSEGDANHDQLVDAADLSVWTNQFGQTPSPSLQSVPEPAAAWLAALAALFLMANSSYHQRLSARSSVG